MIDMELRVSLTGSTCSDIMDQLEREWQTFVDDRSASLRVCDVDLTVRRVRDDDDSDVVCYVADAVVREREW